MQEKILELLQKKHNQSGGHCGLLQTDLITGLQTTFEEIRSDLIELWKEKKITVHPSVHGKIIKINASNASK